MKTLFICTIISLTISFSVLAEKKEDGKQDNAPKTRVIKNNPLHDVDYEELKNVYGSLVAKNCIGFNRFMLTPLPKNYGARKDKIMIAKYQKKECESYAKNTPYSFEQVTDPLAVHRYKIESRLASCRKYGKEMRKIAKCDALEKKHNR